MEDIITIVKLGIFINIPDGAMLETQLVKVTGNTMEMLDKIENYRHGLVVGNGRIIIKSVPVKINKKDTVIQLTKTSDNYEWYHAHALPDTFIIKRLVEKFETRYA